MAAKSKTISVCGKSYDVSSNIPMPKHKGRWSDLLCGMTVGDSVLMTEEDATRFVSATRSRAGFKTRKIDGEGVRVWLSEIRDVRNGGVLK